MFINDCLSFFHQSSMKVLVFGIMLVLGNLVRGEESNDEIAFFYAMASSNLIENLKNDFSDFNDARIRETLSKVASLRLVEARDSLVKNLWYVPFLSKIKKEMKGSPVDPVMPMSASTSTPEGFYPVYYSILQIGICYNELAHHIELATSNEKNLLADAASIDLGLSFGGDYFRAMCIRKERDDTEGCGNSHIDVLLARGLPQSNDKRFNSGMEFDIVKKYNGVQVVLGNRFAEELAVSSPTIVDTIRTMGFIRSLKAIPLLTENLTICPQVSTNAPGGYAFPAAEALIEIGPAIGYCFAQLEETKPLSVEESLWLRISHELYPEGLEYDLMRRAETNDTRAVRLLNALPWRRLDSNYDIIGNSGKREERNNGSE